MALSNRQPYGVVLSTAFILVRTEIRSLWPVSLTLKQRRAKMQYASRKIKWLLIFVVMLVSIIALSIPNGRSANAAAASACSDCALDCLNEANYLMTECWRQGGSTSQCNGIYDQYANNCKAVFCNYGLGCNFPIN